MDFDWNNNYKNYCIIKKKIFSGWEIKEQRQLQTKQQREIIKPEKSTTSKTQWSLFYNYHSFCYPLIRKQAAAESSILIFSQLIVWCLHRLHILFFFFLSTCPLWTKACCPQCTRGSSRCLGWAVTKCNCCEIVIEFC